VTIDPGTVVAERYRVVSLLGEGGMGAVYQVEHLHMRKAFALKVLHGALASQAQIVARFEREAVAAGSIEHPNVAAATDFGRLPDGSFFLILELVRGRRLRDELEPGPFEPARALKVLRGIVAGVGAAHAKGIVHRDLKPENVMLVAADGDPDFVKVLDFGVAKLENASPSGQGGAPTPLTRMGAVLGTLEYMSPEQSLGNPVDVRSDLYSIGVIFFELLAGDCPFDGTPAELLQQHVLGEVPSLPAEVAAKVDPRIAGIVKRLLAKKPEERFATAAELGAALDELAAPHRVVVAAKAPSRPPPSPIEASVKALREARPPVLAAGAAIGVALLIGLGVALHHGDAADKETGATPVALASAPVASVARTAARAAAAPPTAATARAGVDLPPAPSPPDDSANAPSGRGSAAASGSSTPTHRKTGPGGIYIPPPSEWFR
jgi:serine/threonine-protein kinase